MENRPLDQFMQNQTKEENHRHSWTNCKKKIFSSAYYVETHLFSIYILFVVSISNSAPYSLSFSLYC